VGLDGSTFGTALEGARLIAMINTTHAVLKDDLFELEQGFWTGGETYFLKHVDEKCLLVFPTMLDFHGIHSREEVAATARQPNRWRDVQFSQRQFVQPAADVAILSYRVTARQADNAPYAALIGSVYASRGDGWKLTFHQHSPI
jgi:hypothetical protein